MKHDLCMKCLWGIVGVIIIGGIKRIATVTEKIVPFMALMYLIACLYIILSNSVNPAFK